MVDNAVMAVGEQSDPFFGDMHAAGGGVTVEALLRAAVGLLRDHSESPRLDAEVLLAHAAGRARGWLYAHREETVSAAQATRYRSLVRERQSGRPVAQLTGEKEFWSLPLRVTADVLTPRPDTETLVERALARLPAGEARRVVDLGTGSGAVALALATERPHCAVCAVDLSAAALAVARGNADSLGASGLRFVAGDWWDAVPGEAFDVAVANPPYLAEAELATADPALRFEPRLALTSGADGLDALRAIIAGAPAHLVTPGWLLLEHGPTQGAAVRALLEAAGFTQVCTWQDLAGRPRVTEGRWPGGAR
jgi:release factor glutamine methyltransferase